MSNVAEYKRLLVDSLQARADGDGYGEDRIGDILDRLWEKLTPEEKTETAIFVRRLSKCLDFDGSVIAPLPEMP